MAEPALFAANEFVTIPHVDKEYEGKVLKAQYREAEGQWFYFIHYLGWNKKWDEWVEEAGLQKAATAGRAQANARRARHGGAGGGAKRKRADEVALAAPDFHVELDIPALLKQQLVDDHDAIHQGPPALVPLPRTPTVTGILEQYLAETKCSRAAAEAQQDLVAGLQLYFDKALYQCLLYAPERGQADQALAGGALPSGLYGAEHLLRLFVKLPELLPASGATAEQQAALARRLEDVLAFLQSHQDTLFLKRAGYTAKAIPPATPHHHTPKEEPISQAAAAAVEGDLARVAAAAAEVAQGAPAAGSPPPPPQAAAAAAAAPAAAGEVPQEAAAAAAAGAADVPEEPAAAAAAAEAAPPPPAAAGGGDAMEEDT